MQARNPEVIGFQHSAGRDYVSLSATPLRLLCTVALLVPFRLAEPLSPKAQVR
jgi:hypothetical protein